MTGVISEMKQAFSHTNTQEMNNYNNKTEIACEREQDSGREGKKAIWNEKMRQKCLLPNKENRNAMSLKPFE